MPQVFVSAAVEGIVDAVVVRRLVEDAGAHLGPIYGQQGKSWLRTKITGFNSAATRCPWFVLADLDHEDVCAAPVRDAWLPSPADGMCLRFAVRSVEAWLMADRESIASFLGVSLQRIPTDLEALEDPKGELVRIAARGRRAIQQDMVPRPTAGTRVGPAYASRVIEFASTQWRPTVAASSSDSLRRAIECLERLVLLGRQHPDLTMAKDRHHSRA